MYESTRNLLLRWLKVPPEPHAPVGDPASLRVFRAGRNYFNLRLFGWGVAQILALAGIVFWTVVLIQVEDAARAQKLSRPALAPAPAAGAAINPTPAAGPPGPAPRSFQENVEDWKKSFEKNIKQVAGKIDGKSHQRINSWAAMKQVLVEFALLLPPWAFPVIWVLKITGITIYLLQIPFTYALRRLDYEMRWYVVTDRSLRIRTGVWKVQELTMSFANLQQVVVTQNPVQRLLGLADVLVKSAGGGMTMQRHGAPELSLHAGYFHGVEHATEIRDLIQARLKHFRESGLGDPEEARRRPPSPPAGDAAVPPTGANPGLLDAACELRDEARRLRIALGQAS